MGACPRIWNEGSQPVTDRSACGRRRGAAWVRAEQCCCRFLREVLRLSAVDASNMFMYTSSHLTLAIDRLMQSTSTLQGEGLKDVSHAKAGPHIPACPIRAGAYQGISQVAASKAVLSSNDKSMRIRHLLDCSRHSSSLGSRNLNLLESTMFGVHSQPYDWSLTQGPQSSHCVAAKARHV